MLVGILLDWMHRLHCVHYLSHYYYARGSSFSFNSSIYFQDGGEPRDKTRAIYVVRLGHQRKLGHRQRVAGDQSSSGNPHGL